jgi:hypothetical protein
MTEETTVTPFEVVWVVTAALAERGIVADTGQPREARYAASALLRALGLESHQPPRRRAIESPTALLPTVTASGHPDLRALPGGRKP